MMARIRTIKPEFFTDAAIVECSTNARLAFVGTWVFADDFGNLDRSARQLKAQVFPADNIDTEPLIQELIAQRLLVEYSSNGKTYLHIQGFTKHQRVDRIGPARCPAYQNSSNDQRTIDEGSTNDRRALATEGKGREGIKTIPPRKSSAPARVNGSEAKTAQTWEAYSSAYRNRYRADPTRNKKVNGMLARLIERVPAEEAPAIAAFYLSSDRGLYTSAHHCVDLLLRDAEALRTEWQTGQHEAQQVRRAVV